ncbi:MAG: prepilin-type N-terminal cleavage/methylation domain-containing protein [Candidatus Delongbacteria bacterium]|nr:prepilin-type N-terminal cleavage/methylation domain-containing protein [Candidatus Delongbacteria bacterium]
MSKITQKNQNGFTLIEVMIAITVLAIGILGVAKMQLSAVKGNSYASGLTEATAFAQNKMEELVALAYDDADLYDDDGDDDDLNDGDGTNQDDNDNGIDDDDEGTSVDGISNFGLDDTTLHPDGSQQGSGATNIQYNIFWNIAVDEPAVNAKHIRVYVQWQQNGATRNVVLDVIKADI